MKKSKCVKKRNPTVVHMMFRKAGSHTKSKKALRKKENQDFKKDGYDE